mmetsp:Transcript_150976/g.485187  ORF Transcript_150976/g.485187 Transcript_150976/m.485187 type:complete len:152 (+) Transcript_150976:137-592(+)
MRRRLLWCRRQSFPPCTPFPAAALQAGPCSGGVWRGQVVPPGSGGNSTCSGNVCCHEYGFTYPCPGADDVFKAHRCSDLDGFQTWPNQSTYQTPPDRLQRQVPSISCVFNVNLKNLLAGQKIANAEVLTSRDHGFADAFKPPIVQNDTKLL